VESTKGNLRGRDLDDFEAPVLAVIIVLFVPARYRATIIAAISHACRSFPAFWAMNSGILLEIVSSSPSRYRPVSGRRRTSSRSRTLVRTHADGKVAYRARP